MQKHGINNMFSIDNFTLETIFPIIMLSLCPFLDLLDRSKLTHVAHPQK